MESNTSSSSEASFRRYSRSDTENKEVKVYRTNIEKKSLFSESWTAHSLTDEQIELVYSHFNDYSFQEWLEILKAAVKYHRNDPLLPKSKYKFLADLCEGPLEGQTMEEWESFVKFEAFIIHEWSIYPEVRNCTMPIDENCSEDYNTLRVYVISIIWAVCGAVIATFFSPRTPAISMSTMTLQILIAGSGHLWALLPKMKVPIGFGKSFVINNGLPWSFKEQMLATLGMSVAAGNPYSQYSIIAQSNDYFYGTNEAKNYGYMITLTLSSAFMGFGFAGIFKPLLVYQSRMMWPSLLASLPLSRALVSSDRRETIDGWKLKRYEWFGICFLVFFCWYWICNNLISFISYFDWMCYIRPQNVNINAITGLWTGIGINPISSLDFGVIGPLGGILIPVYAYANVMIGLLISTLAVIVIWYTNVANTGYFPIASNLLYDNEANAYDVSKILNPLTNILDVSKYEQYSLPFYSASNLVSYGSFFMLYPMAVVYGLINYWTELKEGYRLMLKGFLYWKPQRSIDFFNDSFCRRQQRYSDVPEWVYILVLVLSFGMAIGCVEGYRFTDCPVWSILLGIGLAFVFIPISGILAAVTSHSFETNVLFELLMGYLREGHGNSLMISKVFATTFFSQTDNWITNHKQAHYSGLSPWSLFSIQCTTTVITTFIQCGIMSFQLNGGIKNMCNPKNPQFFTCQGVRTYFNSSVIWGVIGPRRVFEGLYPKMKWCFLIGACIPLPFGLWRRLGPRLSEKLNLGPHISYFASGKWLSQVNELLIVTCMLSPGFGVTLIDWYVHLFFQLWVRQRYPMWWSKYAYLLIAGISCGVGWGGFFNFWATQYNHIVHLSAWTNDVVVQTSDFNYTAQRLTLKKNQYFGPRRGSLPI